MRGVGIPIAEQGIIAPFNSHVIRIRLQQFLPTVNDFVPYTGTDVHARLSRMPTGHDFNGYPSTIFGPRTLSPTSEPGWFTGTLDADDITGILSGLVGQVIYQIVECAYGGQYFGLTTSKPLLVQDPRIPIGR